MLDIAGSWSAAETEGRSDDTVGSDRGCQSEEYGSGDEGLGEGTPRGSSPGRCTPGAPRGSSLGGSYSSVVNDSGGGTCPYVPLVLVFLVAEGGKVRREASEGR